MKRIFSVFISLIMALSLFGCESTENERTTEESEPISLSPLAGGKIGIFSYKPDTLCPLFSNVSANVQMLNLVFDGLIEVGDHMEAKPCLAESWYASDGGRSWTVSLRQGVHWHDGSDFTAEDVVFTINQIKGAADSPFNANVEYISSVSAEGLYTVKIELARSAAGFINMLYFPVLKNSDSGIDPASYKPVGTGAFSFHDENEGNIYRLRRNEDWWGGKVYLSGIDVHLLPEKNAETYMFSSGEIDIAASGVAAEYKNDAGSESENDDKTEKNKSDKNVGTTSGNTANTKVLSYETSDYTFLGMNHRSRTLEIKTVRRAISYAVNRTDIVEKVLGGAGVAANAPINPSWSVCDNDIDRCVEYKEQKAKTLLDENGWEIKDGVYQKSENGINYRLEFSLLVNKDNAVRTQIAENIAKTLSEFGIKINVVKKDYESYAAAAANGEYDLFVGGYRITPDLDLSMILGSGNVFGFEDSEMSDLLNEIRQSEQSKSRALYGRLQNMFNDKMPFAGLYFEKGAIVTGSRIKGKPAPNMFNIYNGMENVYVETTPREE